MTYNPDILYRHFIGVPGHAEKMITVQTAAIPDIQDAVFHSGVQSAFHAVKAKVFDHHLFAVPFLSEGEMAQVNRFRALKKQLEWICGRFAVKTLVKDALKLDISLAGIQIAYKEKGAPYLPQFPQVPISLSHSGRYTAAAMSRDPGIGLGIDVEKIGSLPETSFMKTAFTPEEIACMPSEARTVFTNWTLKEAFLKYVGLGFNERLHSVAVIKENIFYHGRKQTVHIWSSYLDSQYAVGLVYGGLFKNK